MKVSLELYHNYKVKREQIGRGYTCTFQHLITWMNKCGGNIMYAYKHLISQIKNKYYVYYTFRAMSILSYDQLV